MFFKEMLNYLKNHKKAWLTPILIVVILLGLSLMLAGGNGASPFKYTLF